jgi:hypothetical protein
MEDDITLLEITAPVRKTGLSNQEILSPRRPALDTVKLFSATEFEDFVREWAYGYLAKKYKHVYRRGGANDMGRDIVAYEDDQKTIVDYYQCKHYGQPLVPTEIWKDIGKLCYFTFKGEYKMPRKYYVVALHGLGPNLGKMIDENPAELRSQLIENWNKYCQNEITAKTSIPLEQQLLDHINKIDFSIFSSKDVLELIEEHSKTVWHVPRFGFSLKPRPKTSSVPPEIAGSESRYIEQLLSAYSDKNKAEIPNISELNNYPDEVRHLIRQRESFFSAESLRIHARESLPPECDEFGKLKQDIFDGVINEVEKAHLNGLERVNTVTDRAMTLPVQGNILAEQIENRDKQGICHHLANENKITWVPKHEK